MLLSRKSAWIPCTLCAVAIALILVGLWPSTVDATRAPVPDAEPDFILATHTYDDSAHPVGAVPFAEQESALERVNEEIAHAAPECFWCGAYRLSDASNEQYHRLLLGTKSYAVLFVEEAAHSVWAPEQDWLLAECGTITREDELVRLVSAHAHADPHVPREMICVHDGPSRWLAEPWLVPAAFYSDEPSDRPFPSVRGAGFVAEEHALDPLDRPKVPAAYARERERLGNYRLVSITPAREAGGAASASFERLTNAEIAPFDRLWWDGEACTRIRAQVREVSAAGVIASIELPSGGSLSRLAPGDLFARLPRLE